MDGFSSAPRAHLQQREWVTMVTVMPCVSVKLSHHSQWDFFLKGSIHCAISQMSQAPHDVLFTASQQGAPYQLIVVASGPVLRRKRLLLTFHKVLCCYIKVWDHTAVLTI